MTKPSVMLLCGSFSRPTQDGHHDVIFEDLDGAAGDKVERREHVSRVDQCVSRGCMGGLEPHGQGPEAAFGSSTKCLTALQKVLVEVKADICLQALWETLQDLSGKDGQSIEVQLGAMWTFVVFFVVVSLSCNFECVFNLGLG